LAQLFRKYLANEQERGSDIVDVSLMICTIILSKKEVKLGIVGGASLADPNHLMEGAGKKHRYVVLNEVADLKKKKGIAELIRAKDQELVRIR
jgi:hypothetical protein